MKEVMFLSHVVSQEEISVDPSKNVKLKQFQIGKN